MPDPLITIDAAAEIARANGFANINKRWFERGIAKGAIRAHEGVVPYLFESEVIALVESLKLQARMLNGEQPAS